MLEFLASKVAMMMAMVVMVSVVSSVFAIERDVLRGGELQHVADDIASAIEAMTMRGAEGTSRMTFSESDADEGAAGRSVPMAVAGGTYTITISQTQVQVSQRGMLRVSDFRGRAHLFDPDAAAEGDRVMSQGELGALDEAAGPLALTSGQDLALRNIQFRLNGNDVMLTFVAIIG